MCQFLTKETQFIVKFYSPKLLFTKTESLVVFEMADNFLNICEGSVGPMLNQFSTPDCQVVNPFTTAHTKPVFIRLSSECANYRKIGTEPAQKCIKSDLYLRGKCFSGRVAIIVKGIKYSHGFTIVSPIIHVCQIMEMASVRKENEVNLVHSICILDEDITNADAQ